MRTLSIGSSHTIHPLTARLLLALCVFWLASAVLAAGIVHLKLSYVYFCWTFVFLLLPQIAFGTTTAVIFLGWCYWLSTGRERPAMCALLLPASLLVWLAPFGVAFRETVRVVMSGLVPLGRFGAEIDGWTELRHCLVPLLWFFVPFALSLWLCWRALPRGGTGFLLKNAEEEKCR